jgi:small subunit ribosomal protein S24e
MDVEVIEKKQNPLLNRQEIRFKILHPKEPTPNRDSAREKIASENNVKKEQVIIDNLETTFGKSETVGYAKIYPSKEEAMKNEREYHLVRNKLKEGKKVPEKKATLAPGPAPPAGAPAEEKKEEDSKEKEPTAETAADEKKEEEAPAEKKEEK